MNFIYPNAIIHYCAFHILQAWNRNLSSKVLLERLYQRYPERMHADDTLQQYCSKIMTTLKGIMHEQDIDSMYNKIKKFK